MKCMCVCVCASRSTGHGRDAEQAAGSGWGGWGGGLSVQRKVKKSLEERFLLEVWVGGDYGGGGVRGNVYLHLRGAVWTLSW